MELIVGQGALGTSEAEWSGCQHLATVRPWNVPSSFRHILVLAPHPDDETLALGGMLSMLFRTITHVTLLAVTDGEHSHPQSPTVSPKGLAIRRAEEQQRAVTRLGTTPKVIRLGIEDGTVAAHAAKIVDWIENFSEPIDACFAPFRRDGHPDHNATGTAAAVACANAKAPLIEYPIWAWHWARPNSNDLPWGGARRIELDPLAVETKAHAIQAYQTQINPLSNDPADAALLLPPILQRFGRNFEIVFT